MSGIQDIRRVAVIGGGVMGNGIAQTVAQAGFEVTVVDITEEALERTRTRIGKSLDRVVKKGAQTREQADATLARLSTSTDLEATGAEADHVIETVVEDFAIKSDVLRRLDGVCRDEVIFASNTSQFSITSLAAVTGRPDRVIGSHWFNPPPVMKLIEIIRALQTSDETLATVIALAEQYGKETVVCQKDTPGFITSRLIAHLALEAARIVEEGIATADDVNRACQLAFNHAMGPLHTMDLSGLDTFLKVSDALHTQYGERFLPTQNLRSLVAAGDLGHKTGRGFSDYGEAS
ncbi:MAG: 3-hydroxyacyl-CoA dehydrogenase family protein [Solirubrobacteraceae bacterium]|nr:3-hydroxyacyl-CoA dehydrogenase family protein [Patulibacter sp.]